VKPLLVLAFIAVAGAVWCLISRGSTTTVVAVRDGDTITTSDGRTVRLYGIDAPEHEKPYGREARGSSTGNSSL
jgi:endonuclease YncB( thermonuclease family)